MDHRLWAVALAAAPCHALAAQDAAPPPPADDTTEIIVTGRGLAAAPGDAALATIVIGRDRIADSASSRLEDVLRDAAGLQSFRRSDSRSANPTSQGITLRGLGGNAASRALLLVDGVPQADPFGGWVPFTAYATGRIAAIRVTRGAGGGIAGPGALAGTIEIDSIGPRDGGAQVAAGSRDGVDAQAGWGFAAGAGFATAHAQYARGDGFAPIVAADRGPADRAAPYRQASGALRAVVPVGGATELQASLSAFSDRRDRGLALTDIASDGADASVRMVGRGRWGWSLLGYVQTRAFASRFASVDATRTTVTPTLDQYSVPSTGLGGRLELSPPLAAGLTLRLGGDVRAVSGATRELYQFVGDQPTRRREAGGRSLTAGLFADLAREAGPLTLTAGGRIDRWRIADGRLFERALAGATLTDARFADRAGWQPTGRVGGALRVDPAVTLRAAAYRGWRLPTLNELYRPFRLGADAIAANAALTPESVRGVEAGADIVPARGVRLAITGFHNRLNDAIANVTVANGPGVFPGVGFVSAAGVFRRRANLDAIVTRGLEVDAAATVGPVDLTASYALVGARVRDAALAGLRPAQTPRHQASVGAGVDVARGHRLSVTARYVSRQFEDDQNLRALAGAFTLDGRALIALDDRLAVEARIENAFDARVEAAVAANGVVERATPRTAWIGLILRR